MNTDTAILVVDDIEQNLVAMEALLTRPGVTVLRAASGPLALEALLQHDVAVALFDVHMPEMDGFELAEIVRASPRTRHVPIIFLTAAAADQQRSFRGYDAGAVDFLHKPVDPHIIASKVAVFIEIHRQRQQLAQQMQELQRALQLNEMFTAVLSHDLRTPLSVIKLSAELLLMQGKEPIAQTVGRRIKNSGTRMSRMVEQLLDLSRLRSGGLRLRTAPADLGTVCEQICSEFAVSGEGQNIQMLTHGDLKASFDADRLQQVISNLLSNALEHGEEGHAVEIELDGNQADAVHVQVRNHGRIPDSALPHLFEPFHRLEQGESRGLGLGLYIVDQFIKAHGTRVNVRTDASGTVFEFSLPRQAAVTATELLGAPAPPSLRTPAAPA